MSKIKSGISSSFTAEQQKQRRRRIWIVPLGFLVILFLWAFIGKHSLSAEDLARGYSYTVSVSAAECSAGTGYDSRYCQPAV